MGGDGGEDASEKGGEEEEEGEEEWAVEELVVGGVDVRDFGGFELGGDLI